MRLLPSDRLRRSALLACLLAFSSVYFTYTYICVPRAARADTLRLRLDALQASVRQPDREALGHTDLQRRLELHEAHLARLETLIPSSEEVASLLEAVSVEERLAGVEVTMLRPETPEAGGLYDRRSYEMAVEGDYHAIGSFLTAIASMERIMAPANLKVDRAAPAGTRQTVPTYQVVARVRIQTYVISPTRGAEPSEPTASGDAPQ